MKGPVLGRESDPGVVSELPVQNGDLVTQDGNLDILVPIAHGQQPQRGEGVRDGQAGQTKEHSRSSCRTSFFTWWSELAHAARWSICP
ncbi:hypothetical protein ACFQYP_34125 [Nonomuraea antimicrobica]|uniref:hypothetical protein n=1 Tax=Nonomuraea antimicrobica TaxID=561173 RepID=UPI0031F0207A